MNQPKIERRYQSSAHRPYAVEFHLDGCTCTACTACTACAEPVPPPLPVGQLAVAGAVTANVIAFVVDPAGAWAALSSAVLHLLGAR